MGSNFRNYINTFMFDTELPGSGQSISFRPVTTGQLKRLLLYETSEDPIGIEQALDELMQECVVKPEDFDVKNLYIQDRFYLLVEIRKATRGAIYNFQTECTSCGSQSQQIININDLPVTKLKKLQKVNEKKSDSTLKKSVKGKLVEKTPKEPEIITRDDWDVVKLNDNISVRLELVKREHQKKSFDVFKSQNPDDTKISDIEKTIKITTLLYALCIKGIITPEGEETDLPIDEKVFFLDNIQQSEQEKISKWFENNEFGLDFSFDVICKHCGYKERKAVPVENFFY